MTLLDVNLLLYAVNKDAPLHSKAKAWINRTFAGSETVAFSWSVLLAFLRLTTRPGLFRNPLAPELALNLVAAWLAQPAVIILHPGPRHLSILKGLLVSLGTGGNLTSDAHLAALAIEHNAELCSCDGDFARFAGLHWRNPLV
jgi:toxin-antitoxin system PIN domain toxin